MRSSLKIATIAGIPIRFHWTFGLIFLGVIYLALIGFDKTELAWLSLFILSLFACVVLHEYGHALTARHYGVKTRDIILSPIGGIARLERLPEKPMQELLVALAGPMVNIGISFAMVPYFLFNSFDGLQDVIDLLRNRGLSPFDLSSYFIPSLFLLNIALAGFNLLPAFPMDGGRVLRALLSIKTGRSRATQIASYLGQALAVGLVIFGVYGANLTNVFIGIFVFMTAAQEYRMVKLESALSKFTVADLFRRQYTILTATDTIQHAGELLKTGLERNFLVMDENHTQVEGVLHEEFILEALKQADADAIVGEFQSPRFEAITPEETLKELFYKMQEKGYSILPVYEAEALVGVVDVGMINNFLRLQQKLK